MVLLGAHESVAGGLHLAFDRLRQVGGEALQIFTRNQRQWHPQPLSAEEVELFQKAWQESVSLPVGRSCAGRSFSIPGASGTGASLPVGRSSSIPGTSGTKASLPVASHASYLINLASAKPELIDKSIAAFAAEIDRCGRLGIPFVVIHPGSHGGDGVEAGLFRFTAALDLVFAKAAHQEVMVLVETTAGQGTSLGSRFEELAFILTHCRYPERLGVCVDTCHIFAAGYDIRTLPSYLQTMEEFDRVVGVRKIRFFHLNDSKQPLASRVDRHEHIGQGAIGLTGFASLLNDPRFAGHPMVIETEKGDDLQEDRENLRVLRGLIQSNGVDERVHE